MRKLSLLLLFFGLVFFFQFGSENKHQTKFDLPYSVNAEEASENMKPIKEMTYMVFSIVLLAP